MKQYQPKDVKTYNDWLFLAEDYRAKGLTILEQTCRRKASKCTK